MTNNQNQIKVWQPLALSIMLAIGMLFGYKMNDKDQGSLITYVADDNAGAVGQVEELIRFIENRYVDSVDRASLVDKAISSILDELDPHSVYISPDQLLRVNDEMEGNFKGIGVEIFYINDTVNVISTVPGGPSEKAGIQQFDKLISINDSIVAGQGLAFADIRKMLRGDIGEDLNIELLDKDNKPKSVKITISDIPVSSIEGGVMVDEITGYIKINRFGSKTYREFMDTYEQLITEQGMKNIVIDLRDNPGGYLPEATNILSQLFKEKDNLLVYTKGNNDRKFEYESTGKQFFPIDKVAVLIDENSASGSEIIAGAIQDWDRGVIVGRRSFGKGLVQEQYDLNNGGALRLTVARYYTPSGRSIQRTYDDMDSYYQDYQNRYYDGELFSKDSIDNGENEIFETKVLRRKVYGGGGITPDIFVPIDSIEFDPFYNEVLGELPQYTFRKLKRFDASELEVTDIAQEIFQMYLSDKKVSPRFSEISNFEDDMKTLIQRSVIKYTDSKESVYKFDLKTDDEIKATLGYFNSMEKLTDLLDVTSEEN